MHEFFDNIYVIITEKYRRIMYSELVKHLFRLLWKEHTIYVFWENIKVNKWLIVDKNPKWRVLLHIFRNRITFFERDKNMNKGTSLLTYSMHKSWRGLLGANMISYWFVIFNVLNPDFGRYYLPTCRKRIF